MIAYIEEPIKIKNLDTKFLDNISVCYSKNKILPQKIQLTEHDMNWFFSEILMGEVNIEYAWYGGEGCDFAIEIKQNHFKEFMSTPMKDK